MADVLDLFLSDQYAYLSIFTPVPDTTPNPHGECPERAPDRPDVDTYVL